MKENAQPMFHKAYNIPYGLLEQVEEGVKQLCALNIIYPVRRIAWASPVGIVKETDGSIRICVGSHNE